MVCFMFLLNTQVMTLCMSMFKTDNDYFANIAITLYDSYFICGVMLDVYN